MSSIKEMTERLNEKKKEDREYHKLEPNVTLRLAFQPPQIGVNIVQEKLTNQEGKEYEVVSFKNVIDLDDPQQKPKPLNVGKGLSNARLLSKLDFYLTQKGKLTLEITKLGIGKQGNFDIYDYEILPIEEQQPTLEQSKGDGQE